MLVQIVMLIIKQQNLTINVHQYIFLVISLFLVVDDNTTKEKIINSQSVKCNLLDRMHI